MNILPFPLSTYAQRLELIQENLRTRKLAAVLVFDPEKNVLSAVVADAETPLAVDLSYLRSLIESHDYQDFFFENDALQGLLDRATLARDGSSPVRRGAHRFGG